ncbi:Retrovirus-related Pol polyprotein from transposon TNT 1-94 [Senna tora]|uniref:Retrovirus-related Pol polyprotein from transposon TNT 1-94 n=1 Tax=Senna tora TaxID=362788 RepID=A0A835CMF3_9FABA|nr:Retrovirus-related Pol polyprotein from transposon TNT 1-94 [Senna tora]
MFTLYCSKGARLGLGHYPIAGLNPSILLKPTYVNGICRVQRSRGNVLAHLLSILLSACCEVLRLVSSLSSRFTTLPLPNSRMGSEAPKFTLQSFPQPLATKLDDHNYLIWRLQVTTTANGFDLYSYLLGGDSLPKEFLTKEDKENGKVNPEFSNWKKQDQVLMTWMLMSMTEGMVSRMVGCTYSHHVWSAVEEHFATQTRARETQLFTQFRCTKKGTLGMSEYLLKLKKVVDALASIRSPVTERDHIQTILDGLPPEYEGFITTLSLKNKKFTVPQIEAHLLAQEARLEKTKVESSESISANIVQTQSKTYQKGQSSAQFNNGNQRGGFQGRPPFRGRGRNRGGRQGNRTMCQVFGRLGHIAINCYNRFDQNYTAETLRQAQIQHQQNQNSRSGTSNNVEALLATPETLFDASWYPDSGASRHLTNDASNLQDQQPYTGQDLVHTANETGLQIKIVGQSKVNIQNSKVLYLKQLYHVPSVSKNLISVSKFSKDNNVYFEFCADKFCVKSQDSHQVLLKGRMEKGLYVFDSLPLSHKTPKNNHTYSAHLASVSQENSADSSVASSISQFNTTSNETFDLWHCRLDNHGSPIVSSSASDLLTSNMPSVPFNSQSTHDIAVHNLPPVTNDFSVSTTDLSTGDDLASNDNATHSLQSSQSFQSSPQHSSSQVPAAESADQALTQSVPLPTSNTHSMTTRAKAGIFKPKVFLAEVEPTTVQQALTEPKWKAAMDE